MPDEIGGQFKGASHVLITPKRREAVLQMTTIEPAPPAATEHDEIGGHISVDSQRGRASKRRRAIVEVTATVRVPAAASITEIGSGDAPGGRGANVRVTTSTRMPLGQLTHEIGAGNGSGSERATYSLSTKADVPAAANIAALSELQRQRRFCIKSQSRSDRACEAFIARYLGYRPDMPKPEGVVIWKQAAALRRAVEKGVGSSDTLGGEGQASTDNQMSAALSACIPIILIGGEARRAWDKQRAQTEKQMRKLARGLPVWPWVEAIAGFGELGLAIIVGETGDLSNYATKERVWKRLGLAVINGERQQRKSGAEAAAAHGYNPSRRAEVWTISDSMLRHQWRGAKDDVPPHAVGRYGEVYAARKTHTATREWTLGHRENDARRVMAKALVENLWRVWRGMPALPLAGVRDG